MTLKAENSLILEKDISISEIKIEFRNSRLQMFYSKLVLKNFTKFTEKQLCRSLFFSRVTGLQHLFYRTPACKCFCELQVISFNVTLGWLNQAIYVEIDRCISEGARLIHICKGKVWKTRD